MGWTTCSRPILRPRTASPRSRDWRRRSVQADTARGRAPPPIPGVRQALGAVPAPAAKIAGLGDDGTRAAPGRARSSRVISSPRLSRLDQRFDLFAGLWIAAFEPLLFAVGTKLRIVERRGHGRAQRSEAISGNTRRSHERTTETKRRGGGDQQRLVGVVVQEIERERHALELRMGL